jgi:hypothetical protein
MEHYNILDLDHDVSEIIGDYVKEYYIERMKNVYIK